MHLRGREVGENGRRPDQGREPGSQVRGPQAQAGQLCDRLPPPRRCLPSFSRPPSSHTCVSCGRQCCLAYVMYLRSTACGVVGVQGLGVQGLALVGRTLSASGHAAA